MEQSLERKSESSSVGEAPRPLATEGLRILPQLLWILLAAIALALAIKPALHMIESDKISKISVPGVQVEFAREQLARVKSEESTQWLQTPEDFAPFRARIERNAAYLRGARILWVDDNHPQQNLYERRAFSALGLSVDMVRSTQEAMNLMPQEAGPYYHLIISDLGRPGQADASSPCYETPGAPTAAGCGLLAAVRERFGEQAPPVIFYAHVGNGGGTPGHAFGLTNRLDQLLELVLDAVERRRDVPPSVPIDAEVRQAQMTTADASR